jgi:hypothetical protein
MVDFILQYFGEHRERLLTIAANIVIIISLGAYFVKEFFSLGLEDTDFEPQSGPPS